MSERPPLRDILLERVRSGSRRGKRSDPFHIALVVECGGMRCASAAGALQAFADANCADAFDTAHGSSAGACAVAYFMAGQSTEGRKIYFEDICNRRVVSPYRVWSYPSMVDTDFIGDVVVGQRRVIAFERIAAEPGVLNIVTSVVASGKPAVHSGFKTLGDITTAIKATLRVPGPRESGVPMAGGRHLDGGITAPIPVFSALKSGATHVLVIGSQRMGDYHRRNAYVDVESAVLRSMYGRPLADGYRAANAWSGSELQLQAVQGVECVLVARPAEATFCAWHTIDTSILSAVETETRRVAEAFISGSRSFNAQAVASGS